jgi:hypothetical protein
MKKTVAILLTLTLVLSLAIPAFAAESDSRDVTAKYEKTEIGGDDIRSFELSWGDLTFTYAETVEKTWNVNTHDYDEEVTGGWTKDSADITVTSHSNVELKVTMTVASVEDTGVEVTVEGGTGTLEAATPENVNNAPTITGTVKVSGTPNGDVVSAEGVKVASITVTVE